MEGSVLNVKCEDVKTVQQANHFVTEIKIEPEEEEEHLDLNDFEVEKWNDGSEDDNTDDVSVDNDGDDDDDDEDFDMSEAEEDDEKDASGEEQDEEEEEEELETKIMEFNGMKFESKGNYSQCPVCQKEIKSTFIFRHIRLHDEPAGPFSCPYKKCKLQSTRINNLFRHLKVVHKSKTPYICKHQGCTQAFAKSKQLTSHLFQHRSKKKDLQAGQEDSDANNDKESTKKYACEFPDCGKVYGKRHHLKEHERKHTGDMRYKCEVCNKKFFLQSHMKRHLNSHTGIKPHICRWKCGAIFASYGGRMKHERINHYDENPLMTECDICGRPFNNLQQLQKHKRTHLNPEERKAFRCSYCGIMFDTVKLRERHEERHIDGETFDCENCQRSFSNEKNLAHHVRTHHSNNPKANEEAKTQRKKAEDRAKCHTCHICNSSQLFCLTSLRRHISRIHSTNFKCAREGCGKTFKSKYQFDAHEEQHKNRECHLCGKQFTRKQNANVHLMGVHELKKDDLVKLGRWHSKKDDVECPEYLVRSFKKKLVNREKRMNSIVANSPEEAHEDEDEITIKEEPLEISDVNNSLHRI